MKRTVALLLVSICILTAVIYSFLQYAILEPARQMEEDLMQVALSMDKQGDIERAIKTLETLHDRRYCYKKCLGLLGQFENRRNNYPAALIYCRESLNSDRSKCSNGDSLRCMAIAYAGLKQTEKAMSYQEHLLNCKQLPIEDALHLLKHFLAENATARALNLLTLHNMFQSAPIDVKTQANALMKSYGYRVPFRNRTNDQISLPLYSNISVELNSSSNSDMLESTDSQITPTTNGVDANSVIIDKQNEDFQKIIIPESELERQYEGNSWKKDTKETEESHFALELDRNHIILDQIPAIKSQHEVHSEVTESKRIQTLELDSSEVVPLQDEAVNSNINRLEEIQETFDTNLFPNMSEDSSSRIIDINESIPEKSVEYPSIVSDIHQNHATSVNSNFTVSMDSSDGHSPQDQLDRLSNNNSDSLQNLQTQLKSGEQNNQSETKKHPELTPQQERQAKQKEQQQRAARSYVNIASTYLHRGDTAMAMKQINLALKKAPSLSDALFVRSQIYLQQQEYLKAIPDLITVFQDSSGANDTVTDMLCQLVDYCREQHQFSSVVNIYHVLASTITREASNNSDRYICMGDLQWLHFADAYAAMQDYSSAISILDRFMNESEHKADVIDAARHPLSQSIQTMIDHRYVQWLEYTGDHNRTDSFFQRAHERGDISLWEYTDMLLRNNQIDKALFILQEEEKNWRHEIAIVEQQIALLQQKLTPDDNINQSVAVAEEEIPHLQKIFLQEKQKLRHAQLSLGEVLKHFGSVHKYYVTDIDKANAYIKEAMALGVYDRDIRRFVAASPTLKFENEFEKVNHSDELNVLENVDNEKHQTVEMDNAHQTSEEVGIDDMNMLKEDLEMSGKAFPHRRHQLPLFFSNHRWIVNRLSDQPYFSIQQLRGHSLHDQATFSKENRMMMGGSAGLQSLFDQLESNGGEEVSAQDDDDVFRADDSPFERERKRKLQEQKAQVKQEEQERYQRRQDAMLE